MDKKKKLILETPLLEVVPEDIHMVAVNVDLATQFVDSRGTQLSVPWLLHHRSQILLQRPDIALDASHHCDSTLAAEASLQIDRYHVVLGPGHVVARLGAILRLWPPPGGIILLRHRLWHRLWWQQALYETPLGRIGHHLHLGILFQLLDLARGTETG